MTSLRFHRRPAPADQVELRGPESPTVTPPPTRRLGAVAVMGLVGITVVGLVSLALLIPDVLGGVVQAFVGNI